MTPFSSISTRVALVAALVLTAVGASVALAVYEPHQEILETKERQALRDAAQNQHNVIADAVALLRDDAGFLAGTPSVAALGRARRADGVDPESGDDRAALRERLQTIFLSFIRRRPSYSQVRFIGFDDGGREWVRVERTLDNHFRVIGEAEMQRKGVEPYMQAARKLGPGEIHLSEINLNREYGQVTMPRLPVLRAALAVFDAAGEPFGAIVINQNLRGLLDELVRSRPAGSDLYLTNSRGDYLIHREPTAEFGFDLGRPRLMPDEFTSLADFYAGSGPDQQTFEIEQRDETGLNDYVVQMTRVRFDRGRPERFLAIGLLMSRGYLLGESIDVGRRSSLTALGLVGVGVLLLFVYMQRVLRPLHQMALSADRVAAGHYEVELPPDSPNELGLLARSFRSMVEQVQERNESLERRASEIERSKAELERKNIELRDAQRRLEQASAQKSQFLARVSHDLRTPLNSMLLLARDLAENAGGNLTADQIRAAEVLHRSGLDLQDLLNDVLDLSKVEAGRLEVFEEPTDVRALAEGVCEEFLPQARHRGLALRARMRPDAPRTIRTDPRRVRQILRNLLSNAVKYTTEGDVEVEVERRAHEVAFMVVDTGPGMTAEQREQAFDLYRRLEQDERSTVLGTGLGLPISRQLAQLLGGSLELDSRPGQGCRFTLRLPCRELEDAGPERSGASSPAERLLYLTPEGLQTPNSSPLRLLIVDDEEAIRWLLRVRFQGSGWAVETHEAGRGAEAIAAVETGAFDAVILDLHLPDMTGWEVLEHFARQPLARAPRWILYSGADFGEAGRRRAAALGAKPVLKNGSDDGLLAEVKALAGARGPGAESAARRILVVEDDESSLFALSRALRRTGVEVDMARNGREALDALDRGDPIHAVLLDLRMPVMDGRQTLVEIRKHPHRRDLPVLVLTAEAGRGEREQCMAAGATDFLAKPIDFHKLSARLDQVLGRA